jgi:hypothetical protein
MERDGNPGRAERPRWMVVSTLMTRPPNAESERKPCDPCVARYEFGHHELVKEAAVGMPIL